MQPTARWYRSYGRLLRRIGRVLTRLSRADGDPLHFAAPTAPMEVLPPAALPVFGEKRYEGDAVYGYDHLERWRASVRTVAAPLDGASGTTLLLRTANKPGTPPATHPHVLCEGLNLRIDFGRIGRRDDVRHRPGYLPSRGAYPDYQKGALSGVCALLSDGVWLDQFPRDHLRDAFDSFTASESDLPRPDGVIEQPVLFVTREPGEHANLFHAHTDFLSAFESMYMLGLDPHQTQVVLLDNHPPGPFDEVYRHAFSRRHPVVRAESFQGKRILFRHAVFVPPGYASLLFAHLWEADGGAGPIALLVDYGRFLATSFGIHNAPAAGQEPVRVVLITRRPYRAHVERGYLRGQWANAAEVLAGLKSIPSVEVDVIDFARLTFPQQLEIVTSTEILIGVHGAGLAHMLCMREYGGVVEIVGSADQQANFLFPHMGAWSGRPLQRLYCPERYGLFGTFVNADVRALRKIVEDLAAQVRMRRSADAPAAIRRVVA